jgi:hypothetical protein
MTAEFRAIGVLHDGRGEEVGPADEVAIHHLEQAVDIGPIEPADIGRVVDVARRRPDENEPGKAIGLAIRGQHADHAAHRVSDEDHVAKVERMDDVEDILRVAV